MVWRVCDEISCFLCMIRCLILKADSKENDKASAIRSKHSVTEQRRRSKINERYVRINRGFVFGNFALPQSDCGYWYGTLVILYHLCFLSMSAEFVNLFSDFRY